jgi:hypothetical protein
VNVVFGDGHNLLPLVYVANVVDALVLAGRSEATRGRAYNIVDDDEVSQRLHVERMGSALGLQQSTVFLPLPAVFAEKGSEVQATHQSDPRQGSSRPAHAPSPLPVFGPERHGRSPLNSGSSARNAQGHDVGFAQQAQRLIEQLDKSRHAQPWLIVASFLSPHDITLYRLLANLSGAFASDVEDVVPRDLFDPVRFQQMRHDDLTTKPGCQASYQTSYPMWMQPVADRERYSRFYYQLHKNVDEQMMVAYQALRNSRFRDDTIVIFTPDHGDLLGSHADMHQKWYTAYHEAIRVPRARRL